MSSRSVRNLIIGIAILIAGIYVLTRMGKGFISGVQLPGTAASSVSSAAGAIDGVSNLLMLGLGIIVIFLIPVYLAKRSGEKKIKKYTTPQQTDDASHRPAAQQPRQQKK
jgi:hypothetical protein